MTTATHSLLIGSILLSAIGFSACSDDSTDENGVGGSGVGGTGTGGKKAGTGGAVRGGNSAVGGVNSGGSAGTGVASGGVANGGVGGSATATGGTANGGSATGGSRSGGTAGVGVAGAGTATGGRTGGAAGATTATGGTAAGAAGTPVATGGTSAGAAGTPAATGGRTAGAAGALGNGGSVAGAAGAGTAGAAAVAFTKAWTFDTADGWGIKATTSGVPRIDATAGTTFSTGLTPGVATWTVPFVAAANTAITQTALENNFTAVDMTGKTITVSIRWVAGGIGVASAATGGFDVYIVASDADLTEGGSNYVGALALADRGAAAFKSFTYTVPAAAAPWEPAAVRQLSIRLDSRFWVADPQPVFDYTTAVFEIDTITY